MISVTSLKVSGDPSPRVEWWRESMEGKEIPTLVSSKIKWN